MSIRPLEIYSKKIHIMKAVTGANYEGKTVLTNSAWEYVDLWLRRAKGDRAKQALFFWNQAHNFFIASEQLPIESRPLTSYYCCMNAAKALLAINGDKSIDFDNIAHGITSDRRQWGASTNLEQAEVIFTAKGVLSELSKYFGEPGEKKTYTIYDLLYNTPCIHRTFAITYSATELFVPIRDVYFFHDTKIKKGWVQFQVDERYTNGQVTRYFPKRFERVTYNNDGRCIYRSKKRFSWNSHEKWDERIKGLSEYQSKIRKDLHYIYGDMRLWYLKKDLPNNGHILERNSVTLIFAVMHWLSELVRYNPEKFAKLMSTKQNWLIQEFVDTALYHYIDEISCEITKSEIMTAGYRK